MLPNHYHNLMSKVSNKFFLPFLLSCIFLNSCSNKKSETQKQGPPPPVIVDVIIAGMQPINNSIVVNGFVLAHENIDLHPEASGRLTYLNIPDGAEVKAGAVLAKINDAELQAQLSKSKIQLLLAQKNEDRLKKLLAINGVNQADYDIALNSVNNIKADIDLTNAQIEKTIVKAPFTGILGLRMLSPGAFVTNQSVLATLQQINMLKVDFAIPQMYEKIIAKGKEVVVTADNNEKFTAKITASESQVNTSTGNLKVRAILQNVKLRPGSFVKVEIEVGENTQSIIVPTNAIIPDATSKKIILVKEGKGNIVKVETGIRSSYGVEIISGVSVGDSVVVSGVLFVKPKSMVTVRSVKKIEDLINK